MSVGFLSSFQWGMGKPPFINGTQIAQITQILPRRRGGLQMSRRADGAARAESCLT